MKTKGSSLVLFTCLTFILAMSSSSDAQQQDSCYLWYGGADTINVSIGQNVTLNFYVMTPPDVWVADVHFCLGVIDQYVDSLMSDTTGVIEYPFTEWDIAEFLPPYHDAPNMPDGWSSQSFMGISRISGYGPWLHFENPTRCLRWTLRLANDSTNIGDDVYALGNLGRNPVQGATNIGDTLGVQGYFPVEEFSMFHFTGGGYIQGTVSNFSSQPLEGITVINQVTGKQTTTNSSGYYHMGVYPGMHTFIFDGGPEIHDSTISGINIVLNQTVNLNVSLHTLGGISGTVTNLEHGNPVVGAYVELLTTSVTDSTDASGNYTLPLVGPGTYQVRFTHPDYHDTTVSGVVVTYDVYTDRDVQMNDLVGIDDEEADVPAQFSLNQNYPNPFNATTAIEYGLAKDSHVVLVIYDVLGRHVQTLVDSHQPAGYHRVIWNASGFTSGMYFYRINAGDFTERKSMILLK